MKHQIKFAEIHNPLFMEGKNHGTKLYEKDDFKIIYDDQTSEVVIWYKTQISIQHLTAFNCIQPSDPTNWLPWFANTAPPAPKKKTHTSHPMKLTIPSAQVSDPSTQVQNPMPRTLK